ncbi:MAG: hypothetical protein HN900_05880 [Gammaproteobacteria bacterium]|jgi:hypothetical protein|nr:hypothetical protein [Gammaproteobacteria bacterium]MBT7174193.1 hypothetical protein [Gammaproteobacteria bacterium]
MIDRILICGCARSGNTLMFSLIDTGFENIVKVKGGPWGEQVPKEAVEGKVVVGKFPRKASRLYKLMADDLGIIYMMRDPRDVLVSKHFERPRTYWTSVERWIRTATVALEYKDHPNVLLLKYEDLITKPNKAQKAMAEKFNLEAARKFEDCYESFDTKDKYNAKTMNGIRPLDKSRIGAWKDGYLNEKFINRLMKNSEMTDLMKCFDYLD